MNRTVRVRGRDLRVTDEYFDVLHRETDGPVRTSDLKVARRFMPTRRREESNR